MQHSKHGVTTPTKGLSTNNKKNMKSKFKSMVGQQKSPKAIGSARSILKSTPMIQIVIQSAPKQQGVGGPALSKKVTEAGKRLKTPGATGKGTLNSVKSSLKKTMGY